MVSHLYVVDRLMGKFAAASVTLPKGIDEEVRIEDLEADDRATSATVRERIEDFLWTGPNVLILPCSDDFASIFSLTAMGEILDLPSYQIYREDLEPIPAPQDDVAAIRKKHVQGGSPNLGDEQAKKQNCKT